MVSQNVDEIKNKYRIQLEKVLQPRGIAFNGNNPWDVQVHHSRFYEKVVQHGSVGLGEAYMNGWWDAQ